MFSAVAESVSEFYSWVTQKKKKTIENGSKVIKYRNVPTQRPSSVTKSKKTQQKNVIYFLN